MKICKIKGLLAVLLVSLLSSCSETRTEIKTIKPISSAQSDISEGYSAAKSKDYKTAISLFNVSIGKNPSIPEAYYYRGKAYQKLNKIEAAKKDYFKALEVNMKYPEVHNSLGVLYTSQGDYRDAIDSYTVAISFNPNYDKPYINRGVVYFREGSYRKALFDFTRALEINPGSALALKNRANVYIRLGATSALCGDLKQLCDLGNCKSYNKLSNSKICKK
jgi:tetratricopeptide (TPR) repeat protein